MNCKRKKLSAGRTADSGNGRSVPHRVAAFTLIEVLCVMGMLTMLFAASFAALISINRISSRSADYISGMALAQAKINDIRATVYPGTNFLSTATTNINNVSVDLSQAGTSFAVSGTVTSVIQPITWGHLVTVTVIINEPKGSMTNSLQTIVNEYSGGRGS